MLSKYIQDYCFLKVLGYGDNKYIKLVQLKNVKNPGFEDEEQKIIDTDKSQNDFKLDEAISRARSKIFELAICNPWDYFFTGTLDKDKYDRADLAKFHKDFTKWLQNQGRKYGCKIDFLLIPELHSDMQSWHIHGLLRGVPVDDLKQFVIGDTMGKGIAEKVIKGDILYNWISYQKKFGFCDLAPIKNPVAVSKYITKYITKNLTRSVSDVGAHMYYRSRGLNSATLIAKGYYNSDFNATYQNDYVRIIEINYSDEKLKQICENIVNI